MSQRYYDIIIIGSGIAGLYAAYNIKKMSPSTSFIILEKYKKNWIGGRTSNDVFYGTQVVTGAGVGRKAKDKLLIHLLNELLVFHSLFPLNER
jgi:protoporphyrinogen oxidase